jgi:formylglycine-generating enzyme required for sulfatase activity/dienelactone hydrolase
MARSIVIASVVAACSSGPAEVPRAAPTAGVAVQLREADGTILDATYYDAAARPGPGVVLFHQSNRTRTSWTELASQLAAAGIHVLAVDHRNAAKPPEWKLAREQLLPAEVDTAFDYLAAQPGVDRNRIGAGGAGWLGVDHAVELARRHAEVRTLVLISGETLRPQLEFLRHAPQLPELFVVSDEDEYPPTVEAMELLYIAAASPSKRLVHYAARREAPWLWYETSDPAKVKAAGQHGTDLFATHPDLPGTIVDWFVTALVTTPGHARAETVAAARVLNDVETPGGVERARQALVDARRADPQAQLWPEVTMEIIGADHQREGELDAAVAIWELEALAYPDSADACSDLADAYLQTGRLDLARREVDRGLALFRAHQFPSSSWSDTPQRRGEVQKALDDVVQRIATTSTAVHAVDGAFRDCPDCPEMRVVPAGSFVMGSSADDQAWAASHGGTRAAVADEAPAHTVAVRSFALGTYDVTRAEYAAFVHDTGHPASDGCAETSMPGARMQSTTWSNPGFTQTDRDPVVCVSWYDARAFVDWLSAKTHVAYRLPTEAEWEYAARGGTTTRFWWGADEHPVGAQPANPFGLHDIVGDVWQWTEDCYADSYAGAPSDGTARAWIAECMRVDRGGSWKYPAWLLRSATRERNPPGYRDAIMGFRVARPLP